jgi:nucleoside 2-deoxyribosyltransferase
MEDIINGEFCPITGWLVSNAVLQDNDWKYTVSCGNYSFTLWISNDCLNSQAIRDQKHFVRWLIVTGRINRIKAQDLSSQSKFLLTEKIILDTITESFVPNTPKEKSEQLLLMLYREFPTFKGDINRGVLYCLSFFPNIEEYRIYLDYLVESGYIITKESPNPTKIPSAERIIEPEINVKFKFQGIQLLASLEESGRNSKNCFIAMSFSEKPKIVKIKEAIKFAVNETKYHPIIINEKHIESDRTINDAIIAEIKRSKFVVADFTEQKSGVYFEAGFALGLGIPVIYCCDKDDFEKNSHFDVNHYPHILYNSPEELRKGLVDKIRAFID